MRLFRSSVAAAALVAASSFAVSRFVPFDWISRDGRFYVNVNDTLAERGSLDQSEFAASWYTGRHPGYRDLDIAWSNIAVGARGEAYPKHPLLLPVLSTPLYFAFGLVGTLAFNVAVVALLAGACAALGRSFGVPELHAGLAALLFVFATGVREHIYGYGVDVLLTLFTAGSVVLLRERRFLWAGVLLGLGATIKPTTLALLPALALLARGVPARRELVRAVLGLATPLAAWAAANTILFGRPWYTGYSRVLTVANGAPQIADSMDFFSVPLSSGLDRMLFGDYALVDRWLVLAPALLGLVASIRRAPRYALGAAAALTVFVPVFAKYAFDGDRFLWPAFVVLVPALGRALVLLAQPLAWTAGRLGARPRGHGVRLFGACVVACVVVYVCGWPPPRGYPPFGRAPAEYFYGNALQTAAGVAAVGGAIGLSLLVRIGRADGPLLWLGFAALALTGGLRPPPEATTPLIALGLSLALGGAATRQHRFPRAARAARCVGRLIGAPFRLVASGVRAVLARPALRTHPTRAGVLAIGLACALLAGIGLSRRAVRAAAPFRFDSVEAVRRANVRAGELACDFLSWEVMSWECSRFDRGVDERTGLRTHSRVPIDGEPSGMFALAARPHAPRVVTWRAANLGSRVRVEWAIPDGYEGGGELTVDVRGARVADLALPERPARGAIEANVPPTLAGAVPELEVRLSCPPPRRNCGVALAGGAAGER